MFTSLRERRDKPMKELAITVTGLAGAIIVQALGGWDTALQTLLIFMAADYASGMILAGVFKKSKHGSGAISSKQCWRGLVRKGMQLVLVLAAYRLDTLAGTDFVRMAAIIAFISSEMISLTENASLMGIPVPPALKRALEVLNYPKK
jgi:toxin secretion/phage lysis holin